VDLHRVPLHELHRRLGARMVPFAGYEMPLNYPAGVLAEHHHTRAASSLFDTSHMGQIVLRPRDGSLGAVAAALESLVPGDIAGLAPGRQLYTLFTTESGGVIDDLMVANLGDRLLLIVNAARKAEDAAHLSRCLGDRVEIEILADRALLALQGPGAAAAAERLSPGLAALRFMDVAEMRLAGADCVVSRSGYTGEDGFEIGLAAERAEALALALLEDPAVRPAGLGARDSLRLEAGLCLYGADLDLETTPVEADLAWTVARRRRAGGFPGSAVVLGQLAAGPARRRVGLRIEGRTPVRAGAGVFAGEAPVGRVTSGGFAPSLGHPVAMASLDVAALSGAELHAELRGGRLAVTLVPLPFVPHRYRRG
jgi:aminomethyltransferase